MSAIGEYYRRTKGYDFLLNNIHNQVTNQYLNKDFTEEHTIAKEMERKLRKLKSGIKILKNHSDILQEGELNTQITERTLQNLEQALKIVNKMAKKTGRYKNPTEYFYHEDRKTKKGQKRPEQIFERQIAALMALTASNTLNERIKAAKSFATGNQMVTVQGYLSDPQRFKQKTEKKLKEYVKDKSETYKKASQHAFKQGKIDIDFTAVDTTLIAQSDISPFMKQLLSILAGKTFSLKNYGSLTWKKVEDIPKNAVLEIVSEDKKRAAIKKSDYRISFGDTDLYKVILGSLYEFQSSSQIRHIIYFRGLHYIDGTAKESGTSSKESVTEHWSHLKIIYEIKGAGLIDKEGNPVAPVQYIILNDPSTENIYVESANFLIQQVIKNRIALGSKGSLGGVELGATYFKFD